MPTHRYETTPPATLSRIHEASPAVFHKPCIERGDEPPPDATSALIVPLLCLRAMRLNIEGLRHSLAPRRSNPESTHNPRAPSLRFARGLRILGRRAAAQDRDCLALISAAAHGCAFSLWRAALRRRRTRPGRASARIRGRTPSQVRLRPGLSARLRALRGRLSSCR